ncbi:hypothetical protein [Arenimonas sp.]|uniref:hypothetical protein n=1 Tax=Arenimonas sp. TaxID=1872635 RepID=UPI0039E5AFC9
MTLDDVLEKWIPYRLQAIETMQFAWEWMGESELPRHVDLVVDGKLKLRGNVAMIANPMFEVGIIHARALLEFLGLCVVKGKLGQITNRRPDDIAVEQYSTPAFPLSIVSPSAALAAYPGPRADAEDALVAIFEWANKGLAHLTTGSLSGNYTDMHLDIACRGIPVLLHNHLYAKLGRTIPAPPSATPANGG